MSAERKRVVLSAVCWATSDAFQFLRQPLHTFQRDRDIALLPAWGCTVVVRAGQVVSGCWWPPRKRSHVSSHVFCFFLFSRVALGSGRQARPPNLGLACLAPLCVLIRKRSWPSSGTDPSGTSHQTGQQPHRADDDDSSSKLGEEKGLLSSVSRKGSLHAWP